MLSVCSGEQLIEKIEVLVSTCGGSNYPLELPHPHGCLEDWPGFGRWQHHCHEGQLLCCFASAAVLSSLIALLLSFCCSSVVRDCSAAVLLSLITLLPVYVCA